MRWNRPGRGPVSPDIFIPVAEKTGLIEPLGIFVLRTAPARRPSHGRSSTIAVNVSPGQFRNPAFPDHVRRLLEAADIEPAA